MQSAICEFIRNIEKSRGRNIRVGFLGIGTTTLPIIDTVSRFFPHIELSVRQESDSGYKQAEDLQKSLKLIKGRSAFCDVYEDILFASPSVRRERLSCSNRTVVTSDAEIFFGKRPSGCFLITGSDGKSTVTTLTSLLLEEKFPELFLGGNLGVPLAKADLNLHVAYAIELSSFTLRYLTPQSDRAIITGITPNHLNWHDSYEEYIDTKRGILEKSKEPIISIDTEESERIARQMRLFAVCSASLPLADIKNAYHTEHVISLEGDHILLDGAKVISTDQIKRKERYNLQNLMSAIAMTLGHTDKENIRRVASSFPGLEHRCQTVANINGVSFIDSSIDTSAERTAATLNSLGKRVKIILGGRTKGLSNAPLYPALKKYADKVAIYSDAREDLGELFKTTDLKEIPHACFADFESAFEYITEDLKDGDTVLLSPAATAYGEFRDFTERAARFLQLIEEKYKGRS